MFLPNLDGDTVDAPGRRKYGRDGSGRGRRTAAGLLTFGCWCTGRASCLFSSFGRHFLKEGVWWWFLVSGLTFDFAKNWGGRDEDDGTWVASTKSKRQKKETLSSVFV